VPDRAFRLLKQLPLFASLPDATIENIACCARSDRFAAGQTIVRAGHEDEGFHVVESGTVEHHAEGASAQRLGEGEYFGHDALLRHAPCPATISAVTSVTTLTVSRMDFLSCVTALGRGSLVGRGTAPSKPFAAALPGQVGRGTA
jgi:CRP-like cAMP-binding protein